MPLNTKISAAALKANLVHHLSYLLLLKLFCAFDLNDYSSAVSLILTVQTRPSETTTLLVVWGRAQQDQYLSHSDQSKPSAPRLQQLQTQPGWAGVGSPISSFQSPPPHHGNKSFPPFQVEILMEAFETVKELWKKKGSTATAAKQGDQVWQRALQCPRGAPRHSLLKPTQLRNQRFIEHLWNPSCTLTTNQLKLETIVATDVSRLVQRQL